MPGLFLIPSEIDYAKMNMSKLDKARNQYSPHLPSVFSSDSRGFTTEPGPNSSQFADEIASSFPNSINKPVVTVGPGEGLSTNPLTLGVVFSGGQAPGGHNVVAGLFDAIRKANPAGRLFGFLGGPKGIIKNKYTEITDELLISYRNTGGFDLIGSGRDKIEKIEHLEACESNLKALGVDGLVIVGGDDSNTNAAVLAEHLLAQGSPIKVIGVPKTIDGDMKNDYIETSFGFDTAAKVYSELVGSICRDAMSARKYWHFVKLMGRAASHIALEVALQTHPNVAIISEEVEARQWKLEEVVQQIVDAVTSRQRAGKSFGVVLIPEGLLEFTVDVKAMIVELSAILGEHGEYIGSLPDHSERVQFLANKMSAETNQVYNTLPEGIQEVLLTRDKHDNIPLSQVETEKLLIDLVSDQIRFLKAEKKFEGEFNALPHFFGYEGRCVQPSNFDTDYCYSLGYTACQLVRGGYTGYTVAARNLAAPVADWVMGGIPVTSMLTIEMRGGKPKPVIKKKLVELESPAFKAFAAARAGWTVDDDYLFPGPIQYFGPDELVNARTKTLVLEKGG